MKLSEDEVTKAASAYKAGRPLTPLAERYGVSPPTMAKYLREAGVTIRSRGTNAVRKQDSGFDWLGYDVNI